MKSHLMNTIKGRLPENIESLPALEQKVARHFNERLPISRNTNDDFERTMTFGQKLADTVATFGGTWTFIMIFGAIMVLWISINALLLLNRGDTFDPYPYILLNLFLSMLAAIQAPIILMSQNRQSVKDRLDAAHDYEVNLKAELEILSLHEKLDELKEKNWSELIEMQQEQIRLLIKLAKQMTVDSSPSTVNPI